MKEQIRRLGKAYADVRNKPDTIGHMQIEGAFVSGANHMLGLLKYGAESGWINPFYSHEEMIERYIKSL